MFHLQAVKALFQLSHFINVSLHQRTLVIFVHLADDKLRVTPDNELLDPKFYRDPETGKQSFILCSIVGCLLLGKVHLDYVLEVLSGGCNKQHASTGAMQREGTVKVHQPLFACLFDGDARLWNFFVWCWRPLCYEFCQRSALDSRSAFKLEAKA